MQDMVQVRTAKLEAVQCFGFMGNSMDDQDQLFACMEEKIGRISARKSDNQYLVILPGIVPFVGVEVKATDDVPDGMTALLLPADEYVIFRLEEKRLGDFWNLVCTIDNQTKYNIDLSKPRYEIFTPDLQPTGFTEWYFPAQN